MGNAIFRTYYEVSGDGLAICAAHYAKVAEAEATGFALANRFGAGGFRQGHGALGMMHLIFAAKDAPAGFRYSQRESAEHIACVPDKRLSIGKEADAAMKAFENPPSHESLAAALGYQPSSAPMDGYKIYWPHAYRFMFPAERIFIDIPRQADDGWTPPKHLTEVPPSTFMLAMEAHNGEARRQAEAHRAAA